EVAQTLLGVSDEVARNFVGSPDQITASVSGRAEELTRILEDRGHVLVDALGGKSQEFAAEVARVTTQAVDAISGKGFAFTQTMMDNSETIARLINEASDTATSNVARSLAQLQKSAEDTTATAATVLTRTMQGLEETKRGGIPQTKES